MEPLQPRHDADGAHSTDRATDSRVAGPESHAAGATCSSPGAAVARTADARHGDAGLSHLGGGDAVLIALADGDAAASLNHSTPAAAAAVTTAAEAASKSTTLTEPLRQDLSQCMHQADEQLLHATSSGLTASQAEAAAGALEFGNNTAWVAEAAAGSAGSMVPMLGDTLLLRELRLWNGGIQPEPLIGQPHTPNSSGSGSRGQRGGKPRRSPQSSLKRRGRRPAIKSAFQRDIELFTLRVQEEEATAQHCPALPQQAVQPGQPLLQEPLHQPQTAMPCTDGHQQQEGYTALPATSAAAAAAPVHQTLTALLASCLSACSSQAASLKAGGPVADGAACPDTGGAAPAEALAAAQAVQALAGVEVLVQVVGYQLADWRPTLDMKVEGASATDDRLGV